MSAAQQPRAGAADLPSQLRRGNLLRVNIARRVECVCLDCGRTFPNTGGAASHARHARHIVEVNYRAAFAFEPAERVGGAQ